jgi:hypothetical protein
MVKKIVVAGLVGGLVLICWTFVVNGIFRFRVGIDMNRIDNERLVYEVLKHNINEPGRYIFNPEVTDEGFPAGEPVYSVLYGGVGHEVAGRMTLLHLAIGFLAPTLAAWMLSLTSRRVLSSYGRRLLFFSSIGLLIGLIAHLSNFGIGSYPASSALILFAHEIVVWTVMGLAVAWLMKPPESARAA